MKLLFNPKLLTGAFLALALLISSDGYASSSAAVDQVKVEKKYNHIVCSVGSVYSLSDEDPTLLYQFYKKGRLVKNVKSNGISKYISIHMSENIADWDCRVKVI